MIKVKARHEDLARRYTEYEYEYEYDLWSTKWLVSSFYVKEKY